MILRRFTLILVTQIVFIVIASSDGQNARSYDTNDWIPIQPSNGENIDVEKKATGRVLNLDAPAQKFFPDLDYNRKKRPPVQQFLRETVVPKARPNGRPPKIGHAQPYKFENVPHFNHQPYYNSKEVNLPQYEQPPPLRQPQYAPVPPQIQQSKYPVRQQYFQPQQVFEQFNQNLNPTSINQELLGAVMNAPPLEPVPQVHLPPKAAEQNESVQLLYVPLENLKASQPVSQNSEAVYRQAPPPQQLVSYVPQDKQRLANIEGDFIQQALHAHKLQQQIKLGEPIQYQETYTSTTPKPSKKRKPHQPPLAVYMGGNTHSDVTDVLNVLKDAKSIAVQDSISSSSPKIFIGPSTLDAPDGYSKFPLPYLNNISGSRIERKIDQLPFFVAPLSYQAPPGFSKIPLPSPHVGSVIVSHKDEEVLNNINQYQFTDKPVSQPGSEYNFGEQPAFIPPNENFGSSKNPFQEVKEFDQLSHTLPLQYNQQHRLNSQEEIRQIPPQYTQQQFEEQLTYALQKEPLQANYNEDNKGNAYNPPLKTTQYEDFQQYSPIAKETTTPPSREIEFGQHYENPKNFYSTQPEPPKPTYPVKEEKKIVEVRPKPKEQSNPVRQNEEYINPLELAINQYELQQINTQFDSNREGQYEQQPYYTSPRLPLNSSPVTIVKDTYEPITTREPERVRPQRRRKPARVTTTTTTTQRPTEAAIDEGKYTVLEEYTAKSNPSTTQKYLIENNADQFNVYKEQSTTTAKYVDNVEIQPANVYKLTTPQPTENDRPINQNEQQSEVFRLPVNQPTYIPENQQVQSTHQHVLDQQLMDHQILNNLFKNNQEQVQTEPTPVVYHSQNTESQYPQNTDNIEPLVHNRGQAQYNQESYAPSSQTGYSNYPSQEPETSPKEVLPVLQEQAVRPLLTPTLLVPTTEEQQKHYSTVRYESPSTENNIELAKLYSTEPVKVETTTARGRTRSRGRGTSSRYTAPTTTSPTRRTVNRGRRPVPTRTTTERVKINDDYGYDSAERTTRRTVSINNSNSKQRFRTRGRPVANSITERISQSTTENEIKAYNSPTPENVYHGSRTRPEPNSYMQFDHVVDPIVTIRPEENSESGETFKEYHQVYNLQDSKNESPVVDVQITHPVTEPTKATVIQQDEPTTRFIKQNVQVAGVLHNRNINEETTTARTTAKSPRGRTRGRSRFATTTTSRPIQRVTTTTESAPEKQNNEFYGFIRNPTFQEPNTNTQQPTQLYSSTYQSSHKPLIVVGGDDSDTNEDKSPTVQFVGEIRPKFQARNEETTQKPKTRTRGRVPAKRPQEQKQVYNEVSGPGNSEQATRRSSVIRSRGRTHFKSPENVRKKEEVIDENLNYPASFFKSRTTTPKSFQITIAPNANGDDAEEDQAPHPSIYSPRYVPKPDEEWTEISNLPLPNQITIEVKPTKEEPLAVTIDSEEPIALPIVNTELPATTNSEVIVEDETQAVTDGFETTTSFPTTTELVTKKKGRRRGVWKLVRQRPVDNFETAESQNYQSVINTFDTIDKKPSSEEKGVVNEEIVTTEAVAPSTDAPLSSSEEGSLFETLYQMFGMKNDEKVLESDVVQSTTTLPPPTFPEEITEIPTTTTPASVEISSAAVTFVDTTTHVTVNETTTTTPQSTTIQPEQSTKSAYDVEPWEMRAVKTSTSTEVSHETEICYKGRCVKSKNRKLNRNRNV